MVEIPQVETYGFHAGSSHFPVAAQPHRHNEIEIACGIGPDVTLLFGDRPVALGEGRSAVFWAATPHFARRCGGGSRLCWVHVPLRQFLDWRIPGDFTQRLLRGQILRDPATRDPELFLSQIQRWRSYSSSQSAEARRIVDLEVEALYRDLAMRTGAESVDEATVGDAAGPDRIEAMVSYIARRYQDPVTVAQVAAAAGLRSGYAMRLFRAAVGTTIVAYINDYRLGQAQRMLATTDLPVLEILVDAGFGSATQFYTLFERSFGCAPLGYRLRARGLPGG